MIDWKTLATPDPDQTPSSDIDRNGGVLRFYEGKRLLVTVDLPWAYLKVAEMKGTRETLTTRVMETGRPDKYELVRYGRKPMTGDAALFELKGQLLIKGNPFLLNGLKVQN